ncbi:MAG: 3'-5' exonuclease [Bacteroidia bacterium]
MFNQIGLDAILCLDIETVPQYPDYDRVPEEMKKLWLRKAGNLKKEENEDEVSIYPRAGIYAEFGKIICISTGFLSLKDGKRMFRLKSFYGDDEALLLEEFGRLLQHIHENRSMGSKAPMVLCGHNAREFDFPYISRRMIINGIQLPPQLDLFGKKPWEVPHLDTMELWKFGDFKNYTPLNLLAYSLGIPSPKDDIDGSQVGQVYWEEKNLERIVTYCQKDVVTVMQILLRMKNEALLGPLEVIIA